MKFTTEPNVETKISRMKTRVRWSHPQILQRRIDQTTLEIADGHSQEPGFSFLVMGDSGTGNHRGDNPQRRVAEAMLGHQEDCRFALHTGDVVYLVGSKEQYPENFIRPYREWLLGGDNPKAVCYDQMVFKKPILPVLGNHDYYDLPWWVSAASGLTSPLRKLLVARLDLDVGWHGSFQGDAFARAFMDYLQGVPEGQLGAHLDRHYQAETAQGRCLCYTPGEFTRLPNRYYTFRYGGIDFFALDSNTFNEPLPIPNTAEGRQYRAELRDRRDSLEEERSQLLMQATGMGGEPDSDPDDLPEIYTELEQLEEQIADIDKQLSSSDKVIVDFDQLKWLQQRLIQSWQNPEVRGRVLVFHHPPYVTEATKWYQGQTLAVRANLRQVLQAVAAQVGDLAQGRPLVDLVLTGHAHCLEYLKTEDTGHADSHINWLICGGSGFSLRRQRPEGPKLEEGEPSRTVARSHLYLGRTGRGSARKRPYSFLRVDVGAGYPPQITLRPHVVEKHQGAWSAYAKETIEV
ncbi:MAG: metallophosphoesterase [Cyanobacteria bacterium Co-bin13]|nr:metallophosphoesterase [Cyanobacteria bacterium Co-bin13]